jgi:hypothetical protein
MRANATLRTRFDTALRERPVATMTTVTAFCFIVDFVVHIIGRWTRMSGQMRFDEILLAFLFSVLLRHLFATKRDELTILLTAVTVVTAVDVLMKLS